MSTLKRHARLGVIAVASFVLLVTVIPQLASGFGLGALANRLEDTTTTCTGSTGSTGSSGSTSVGSVAAPVVSSIGSSGSSGSSSSQCVPPAGALNGTITITNAPPNFVATYEGVAACPSGQATAQTCTSPIDTLTTNGKFTLSLPAGSWEVVGFYELNAFGGAFLSAGQEVTIPPGQTVTRNFSVPYVAPARLKGQVRVTNVPAGITVQSLSMLLCPSYAPYTGGLSSEACVQGFAQQATTGATSAPFTLAGLPPGQWFAYPSYCTAFGCETNAQEGVSVTLVSNQVRTVNLVTPFVTPPQGQLTATVTIRNAPAGFSATTIVTACQGTTTTNCQTFYAGAGSAQTILLANGQWTVSASYLAPPFNNAVLGDQTRTVTISGGRTTSVALSVAYRTPGTATGNVDVVGLPSTIAVLNYTVLACPASAPLTSSGPSTQCASELSGTGQSEFGFPSPSSLTSQANASFSVYKITALTPGAWILYPGYQTIFGTFMDRTGTRVHVAAGQTTAQDLKLNYVPPSEGAIFGAVDVIGASADGVETGVQACRAPPAGTTCANEQDAFAEGGAYQLVLAPGTWWVSGFVEQFNGGISPTRSVAPAQEVTVGAGSETTQNFVVTAD